MPLGVAGQRLPAPDDEVGVVGASSIDHAQRPSCSQAIRADFNPANRSSTLALGGVTLVGQLGREIGQSMDAAAGYACGSGRGDGSVAGEDQPVLDDEAGGAALAQRAGDGGEVSPCMEEGVMRIGQERVAGLTHRSGGWDSGFALIRGGVRTCDHGESFLRKTVRAAGRTYLVRVRRPSCPPLDCSSKCTG
jgi:hypothetical protein